METPLSAWESFYVIIGSSAAALTGLQFVVIVLGAEVNVLGGSHLTRAFGTPTVVHFCAVLLISATMSAPWPALWAAAWVVGLCGVAGISYGIMVLRHTRRLKDYKPVLEDWIWHNAVPFLAYAALLTSAFSLPHRDVASLFAIGASVLLLLFAGIHNAWDAVTFIAQSGARRRAAGEPERGTRSHPRKESR